MRAPWTDRSTWTVLAATVLALTLVGLSAAAPSGATTRAKVATGSVTCTHVTGTIVYSPTIHHVGTRAGTQKFVLHISGCTTTGSNVRRVEGGTLTFSVHRSLNSCAELLAQVTSHPPVAVLWKPSSVKKSLITFSGFVYVLGPADHVGFHVPPSGGTATVSGSFAGRDHGARSSATLYTNTTARQFQAACEAPTGVSRQSIVSGTATLS